MDLFDVIKTIFKKGKAWDEVGKNDKVKNFFMINRIMSVQFPVQANQFNHTKVSPTTILKLHPGSSLRRRRKRGRTRRKLIFRTTKRLRSSS